MGFWEHVDEELKFLGMSRKELALQADFPDSYISKGIKRNSIPAADLALRIAHALNIPLETLLEMPRPKKSQPTESDRIFLRQWSKLSKNQQEKMLAFLEAMSE